MMAPHSFHAMSWEIELLLSHSLEILLPSYWNQKNCSSLSLSLSLTSHFGKTPFLFDCRCDILFSFLISEVTRLDVPSNILGSPI